MGSITERPFTGVQSLDPARRRAPLTYFHPTGPLGQVFAIFEGETPTLARVAVIGLGTGSAACYATPGQEWSFYEIDPAIEQIATNPRFFTFLQLCLERPHVVLGDARLSLTRAPDAFYDLIIVDAFSSSAIPLHLMTLEAIQLYMDKLAPNGLLVLHISNPYFNLEPVLADSSGALGLSTLAHVDRTVSAAEAADGKLPSHWVVQARRQADLRQLASDPRWYPLHRGHRTRVWTDDYSSVLKVWKHGKGGSAH